MKAGEGIRCAGPGGFVAVVHSSWDLVILAFICGYSEDVAFHFHTVLCKLVVHVQS